MEHQSGEHQYIKKSEKLQELHFLSMCIKYSSLFSATLLMLGGCGVLIKTEIQL